MVTSKMLNLAYAKNAAINAGMTGKWMIQGYMDGHLGKKFKKRFPKDTIFETPRANYFKGFFYGSPLSADDIKKLANS